MGVITDNSKYFDTITSGKRFNIELHDARTGIRFFQHAIPEGYYDDWVSVGKNTFDLIVDSKPSWDRAPRWANYLLLSGNQWQWFQFHPFLLRDIERQPNCVGLKEIASMDTNIRDSYCRDTENTLEENPKGLSIDKREAVRCILEEWDNFRSLNVDCVHEALEKLFEKKKN